MLYARDKRGEVIRAKPKMEGYCRSCKKRLLTKCGEIKIWHWSHKAKHCDYFGEGEIEYE